MEIGIDSFAATMPNPATGLTVPAAHRMEALLAEVETADHVGLDVLGIGEHHRREFLDSAPAVILAAAAARTQRIRLTSAVTVLSAADPVRVFQDFATIDLIAKGRAEIVVGRGSFGEAYPLFGFAMEDYVRDKILAADQALGGISRLTIQMSSAMLETKAMQRSIELLGAEVAPAVKAALGAGAGRG